MVKILKHYKELQKQKKNLPVDDRRGVTEFQAFYHVGDLYAERFSDPAALDVAMEVVENLRDSLQARKIALA